MRVSAALGEGEGVLRNWWDGQVRIDSRWVVQAVQRLVGSIPAAAWPEWSSLMLVGLFVEGGRRRTVGWSFPKPKIERVGLVQKWQGCGEIPGWDGEREGRSQLKVMGWRKEVERVRRVAFGVEVEEEEWCCVGFGELGTASGC